MCRRHFRVWWLKSPKLIVVFAVVVVVAVVPGHCENAVQQRVSGVGLQDSSHPLLMMIAVEDGSGGATTTRNKRLSLNHSETIAFVAEWQFELLAAIRVAFVE